MPENYPTSDGENGREEVGAEESLFDHGNDNHNGNHSDGHNAERPLRRIFPLPGGSELTKAFRPALERAFEESRLRREKQSRD